MKAEDANALIEGHAHDGRDKHPPGTTLSEQMSHLTIVWAKLQTDYQATDPAVPNEHVARRLAQLAATCRTTLEHFWRDPTPVMAQVKDPE